jgi:hypothetical protein
MKVISRLRQRCYCAFCKTARRIYGKKHVDVTNVVMALVFALVTTFAFFGEPDARGLGLFCLFVVGAELFVYLRWRLNIVCNLCGFDPVLYKKSPDMASERVREFFKEQMDNPEFLLSRSPLLQLHKRIRDNEMKTIEYELLLRRTKSSSLAANKSV